MYPSLLFLILFLMGKDLMTEHRTRGSLTE